MEFFKMNFDESFVADLYERGVSCNKTKFNPDMKGYCPWDYGVAIESKKDVAPQALKSDKNIFKRLK